MSVPAMLVALILAACGSTTMRSLTPISPTNLTPAVLAFASKQALTRPERALLLSVTIRATGIEFELAPRSAHAGFQRIDWRFADRRVGSLGYPHTDSGSYGCSVAPGDTSAAAATCGFGVAFRPNDVQRVLALARSRPGDGDLQPLEVSLDYDGWYVLGLIHGTRHSIELPPLKP